MYSTTELYHATLECYTSSYQAPSGLLYACIRKLVETCYR